MLTTMSHSKARTTTQGPDPSIVIAWGSSTGYTEEIAVKLHQHLAYAIASIGDIGETEVRDLLGFDVLILGVPTWNVGELQDDWDYCFDEFADVDLRGKKVALFGCGDAQGYPSYFQDAMGILWRQLEARGAALIGQWPTTGYDFLESQAITPDGRHFFGLAIDEHTQSALTDQRIETWAQQLEAELDLQPAPARVLALASTG